MNGHPMEAPEPPAYMFPPLPNPNGHGQLEMNPHPSAQQHDAAAPAVQLPPMPPWADVEGVPLILPCPLNTLGLVDEWDIGLHRTLRIYDLEEFIMTSVPAPAEPVAAREWARKRATVNMIIHNTLHNPITNAGSLVRILGFDGREEDPKVAYDSVKKIIAEMNRRAERALIKIFRRPFDPRTGLLRHVQILSQIRRRLKSSAWLDQLPVWALEGLAPAFPNDVDNWLRAMGSGVGQWERLMEELIAAGQHYHEGGRQFDMLVA
ncbi:hypothetical protein C8A01DRAFT_37501 [Parachaetomium inaequale]|uniref:Uncharacterized protein n=1 Tax=Parachaetomium inaequale TaxID=2588326 RepID=A0AAN6PCX8_9PEZI|nr:hypothetical protein C8A01DRAFT_37501 [Parachaetomium inaequale]